MDIVQQTFFYDRHNLKLTSVGCQKLSTTLYLGFEQKNNIRTIVRI